MFTLFFLTATASKLPTAAPAKGKRIGGILALLFPNLNRGKN